MSILDDLKAAWKKESETDNPTDKVVATLVAGAIGLVGLFVVGVFLLIMWEIAKALFVPAIIALAVYGAGAYFLGWPIPAFAKKFVK